VKLEIVVGTIARWHIVSQAGRDIAKINLERRGIIASFEIGDLLTVGS
jgi:hypothetical protein